MECLVIYVPPVQCSPVIIMMLGSMYLSLSNIAKLLNINSLSYKIHFSYQCFNRGTLYSTKCLPVSTEL